MHDTTRTVSPEVAAAGLPAGAWAVGVSGGADSVALLRLFAARSDVRLHVVHLDHETREGASAEDAKFVRQLADDLRLPCTLAVRSEIEAAMPELPRNISARYRAARFTLFRKVVAADQLAGVVLAHHADDQAETILHRLLRGSRPEGMTGMATLAMLEGLAIARPLLGVRGQQLRDYLKSIGQSWREDASNRSDTYARNRLRKILAAHPELSPRLRELGERCAALRDWMDAHTPALDEAFPILAMATLPGVLARRAAQRWLIARGVPAGEATAHAADRLIIMACDAASPPAQMFPGRVTVRRRRGIIFLDS